MARLTFAEQCFDAAGGDALGALSIALRVVEMKRAVSAPASSPRSIEDLWESLSLEEMEATLRERGVVK